jgi:hypothetical protein
MYHGNFAVRDESSLGTIEGEAIRDSGRLWLRARRLVTIQPKSAAHLCLGITETKSILWGLIVRQRYHSLVGST